MTSKLVIFILVFAVSSCSSNTKKQMKENSYLDDKVTQERVENELNRRGRSWSSGVQVRSSNGVVFLSGFVKSADQKEKAEQLARQIHRVKGVENRISIQPSRE